MDDGWKHIHTKKARSDAERAFEYRNWYQPVMA